MLTSSDMVNFYTGIENIDAFNTKFDMVSPIVRKQWSSYKKLSKKRVYLGFTLHDLAN